METNNIIYGCIQQYVICHLVLNQYKVSKRKYLESYLAIYVGIKYYIFKKIWFLNHFNQWIKGPFMWLPGYWQQQILFCAIGIRDVMSLLS